MPEQYKQTFFLLIHTNKGNKYKIKLVLESPEPIKPEDFCDMTRNIIYRNHKGETGHPYKWLDENSNMIDCIKYYVGDKK